MPDIDARIVESLIVKGYRYVRYNDKGTLQAAKAVKDSTESPKWEDVEVEAEQQPQMIITMYVGQVIDLDSL